MGGFFYITMNTILEAVITNMTDFLLFQEDRVYFVKVILTLFGGQILNLFTYGCPKIRE